MLIRKWSRQWHRWFAWGTMVMIALWISTGVVMLWTTYPREGDRAVPAQLDLASVQSPSAFHVGADTQVISLSLRRLGAGQVYVVATRPGGTRLLDAVTLAPVLVDESLSVALASAATSHSPEGAVQTVREHDSVYPKGPLPVFRQHFSDGVVAHVALDGAVSFSTRKTRFKVLMNELHAFVVRGVTDERPHLREVLLDLAMALTAVLLLSGIVLLWPVRRARTSQQSGAR